MGIWQMRYNFIESKGGTNDMSEVKKDTNKSKLVVSIVCLVALIIGIILLWIFKVVDIYTAGTLLVALGVIFYWVFTSIYYKNSIMGGKFHDHFKNSND